MATGDRHNGADVLIAVNTSASAPNYEIVAHQRNVNFNQSNALINISSKSSGRRSEYLMGREDEDITLDGLWVEGPAGVAAAYEYLKAAARSGATVMIQRLLNSSAVESCSAVITTNAESFPDNAESTINITLKRTGAWA